MGEPVAEKDSCLFGRLVGVLRRERLMGPVRERLGALDDGE